MPKTVLISGSTSGIGLSIAQAFAKKGYNIVMNGIESNGPAIASELQNEYGVDVMFSSANILNPAEIRSMVKKASEKFTGIDVLVNNAGIQHVAPLEDYPDEKWDAIIQLILTGAFHLTKAVWPYMKRKKKGRIINIVSAHGLVASPYKSAYVSAKHGLVGFTKATALEGATVGITSNAVCPGYTLTKLVEKQIPEQMEAHQLSAEEVINNVLLKSHAIKEFVTIDSITETVMFLADSPASSSITGVALPVDCGWTAQ